MAMSRASRRESRDVESRCRRLPLDVLHRDVVLALGCHPQRVDHAHIRMAEGGCGAGLLLKPRHACGIAREVRGQELERDLPSKVDLRGEPDFAHAPGTEPGDDFVGAEARTCLESHVAAAHYARAEWRIDR